MNVVYERCCGIDVHKKSVVACVIVPGTDGQPVKATRTFETLTGDLQALAAWLQSTGCTHVAMESTGVYWKPVFNLLEGQFEILVVNAEHLKKIAGRKTDVQDAEWIADLLRHGLLKGSFIPSAEQRALRDLTRYRTTLTDERAREVNRVQKFLEDANIKLASVASDVLGASGRAILDALIAGKTDPGTLADLAKGRLRHKKDLLEKALAGTVKPHQRRLLVELLGHIDYLDEALERLDHDIEELMRPFQATLERLDSIPGVSQRVAQIIVAEAGADMKPFADAAHLAAWSGLCPGNNASGGKRRHARARRGDLWLKRALVEAAHGASRTKRTYLSAQYHRLAGRRGAKRAVIAVAHTILEIVFVLITRQETYHDLGANYFDERDKEAVKRRSVRRLEQLGFQVQLTPVTPATG
ncbi:MAG: IS110 family transposase [candidate division KSB1 bacterium]|nr:IS110 family transposase [candidate division KSB1 bacterium]